MGWQNGAKWIHFLSVLFLLTGCSVLAVKPDLPYSKTSRDGLYQLQNWSFDGRLALTGQTDSLSANIAWKHRADFDEIKLSGPLGQGAVLVSLVANTVTIDRGNGIKQFSQDAESFINHELGLVVPVSFLSYWALGLPKADGIESFNETANGFTQIGWLVEYSQMQKIGESVLPKKIRVTDGQVSLKIVIDQWDIDNEK